MAHAIAKASISLPATARLERFRSTKPDDLEAEKLRLRKATTEFESLFMYELLKTMRRTVPQSQDVKQGVLADGLGKDTFTQLFDMELARKMVSGNHGSIADMLYDSLEKVIESQHGIASQPAELNPRIQGPRTLPLNQTQERQIQRSRPAGLRIPPRPPLPADRRALSRGADPILSMFREHIAEAARETTLDPTLIYAVIKAESNGDPRAVSQAGAKGLMQLTDTTVQDYGVTRVFDPRQNILAGSRYLKRLLDRFDDLKLALAAYNAGPTNVVRYGGIPPYAETRAYVDRVTRIIASQRPAGEVQRTKGGIGNTR